MSQSIYNPITKRLETFAGNQEAVAAELGNLSDVNITNVQDGDRIKYDATSQTWKNGPGAKSDWAEENPGSDAFISNKPVLGNAAFCDTSDDAVEDSTDVFTSGGAYTALDGKVDKVSGKGLSTEDFTTAEKTKLSSVTTGAEPNVNADWNESDSTLDSYILNKPTLGSAAEANLTNAATSGSTDALTSGGAYTLLQGKANTATSLSGYGISDAYTKTEVDEMFSELVEGMTWKPAVATYSDIATTYPNPQEGWTVCCTDTNIVWRYSGGQWVKISANTIPLASDSVDGLMSSSGYTKLSGIATGAEVNQNAFSNVKVGSTTVAADSKTDTLELRASNVTLTPDATDDSITIGITKANVTDALGYTPPTSDTNTHRPIQVDGVEALGNNTTALNLKAGSNVTLTNSSGTVTIDSTDTNTHRPIKVNDSEILGNNTTALNLKAGSNVSLSNSSGTVTIAASDTNTHRPIQMGGQQILPSDNISPLNFVAGDNVSIGGTDGNVVISSTGGTSLTGLSLTTSGLTYTNCTYFNGGYCKIGQLVILMLAVRSTSTPTTTTSTHPKITGLPTGIYQFTAFPVTDNYGNGSSVRLENGSIRFSNNYEELAKENHVMIIGGCYIASS